jgi:5S rRNA maturation endonuclease (ribonuclease M5)
VTDYDPFGQVVIVEGELDATVLSQNGFLVVSGTGGAGTWKAEWNENFRDKVVIICYDADEAGERGARKVARALTGVAARVVIVKPFGPDASEDRKDVTDFFVKARKTVEDFQALIQAAQSAETGGSEDKPVFEELQDGTAASTETSLRHDIREISESSPTESKRNEIAAKALDLLLTNGKFLIDGDRIVRFYSGGVHQVFPLESQEFSDYVSIQTGINTASTNFRYIMGLVQVQGRQRGEVVNIYRFCHFDGVKYTLYLNNSPRTFYEITAMGITQRYNGQNEIYFVSDPRAEAFEVNLSLGNETRQTARRELVDNINFDDQLNTILTKDEQRILYWNTLLSMLLSVDNRTKCIMVFIGQAGSGKTTALRMFGISLFGERFEVLSPGTDERDIVAAVSSRFLVIFDNFDQRSKFLDDIMARLATGIAFSRRKLYSDNDEIQILPKAHLGITSRQPQFNREDIADRLLIFRVKRFEEASFKAEGAIIAEIIANRNKIMTGFVLELQIAIANLKRRDSQFKKTAFRMASTGLMLVKIARSPKQMKAILEKMGKEQTKFAGEGHPLTELICRWLKEYPQNSRAWFTTSDLFFELQALSKAHNLHFVHFSVRSLGMALVNDRRQLELRLKIEQDERKTNNLKRYRFGLIPEQLADFPELFQ